MATDAELDFIILGGRVFVAFTPERIEALARVLTWATLRVEEYIGEDEPELAIVRAMLAETGWVEDDAQ